MIDAKELLKDDRFIIDEKFYQSNLAHRKLVYYKVKNVKLSQLKRRYSGVTYSIDKVPPYRYLKGDKGAYTNYTKDIARRYNIESQVDDTNCGKGFDKLIGSLDDKGYDERYMILVNENYRLLDGQHRASYLMFNHGGDFRVDVLMLKFPSNKLKKFLINFIPFSKYRKKLRAYYNIT